MKKILAIFLCLIFVCSVVSCDKKNEDPKPEKNQETTQDSTQKSSNEGKTPYSFISAQERLSWKNKVIDVLSADEHYEQIEYGCLGAALMDLNFDNTPEVIIAYAVELWETSVSSHMTLKPENNYVLLETRPIIKNMITYICVYTEIMRESILS